LVVKLVNLRAGEDQHDAWKQAAARVGLTFSEWTRITLDAAAHARPRVRRPRTTVNSSRPEPVLAGKRSYAPDPKKRK
jgi:hypothetical protein